ncbi:MAG: hypothetical protein LRS46_03055 [Desulfurococcales archaeon]|nr:hypothetical protein [Desulfurococcales archaeon]
MLVEEEREEAAEEEEVIAEPGGVELAKPEAPAGEGEAAETSAGEEAAEEEVSLYHPVVPELLDAFAEAVDILEALAEGKLRPSEAKAIYLEKVKAPAEAIAVEVPEAKRKQTRRKKSSRSSRRSSKR